MKKKKKSVLVNVLLPFLFFFNCQLGQGVLVQLSPSLIKRQKTHFHNLPCGASIILGNNGFVWLYPTPGQQDEGAGGFYTSLEVGSEETETWSKYRYLRCVWEMPLVLFRHPLQLQMWSYVSKHRPQSYSAIVKDFRLLFSQRSTLMNNIAVWPIDGLKKLHTSSGCSCLSVNLGMQSIS